MNEKRSEFTGLWLTPEQKRLLKRMARAEGRFVSGMLRRLVDEETVRRGWVATLPVTEEASDE